MSMIYFILLFIEAIILFLLSRFMSKVLYRFMSINLMSFIFLPGIIIHELSHLFAAVILFVPVGDMEFIPKKDGDGIKLGSVEIGKTDPIRRAVIGFAPAFAGLLIVIGAIYLFSSNISFFQNLNFYVFIAVVLLLTYLLFAVSNTMFSSSADMKGAAEILITLIIIFAGAYILGFRPSLSLMDKIFTKEFIVIIQKSTVFLLVPIAIDLLILGTLKLIRR